MKEISRQHARRRRDGGGIGIGDDPAGFFGCEKEGLILLFINSWNPDRTSDGAPEIVVAQLGARYVVEIIEVIIGVQIVIAEKFIDSAMEGTGARSRDNVDLGAA